MKNSKNLNITSESLKNIIDDHLNSNEFQSSLNGIILSDLSNKKFFNLSREIFVHKIFNSDIIKEKEDKILNNILDSLKIDIAPSRLCDEQIKVKETKFREYKKGNYTNNVDESTQISMLDSLKILKILIEEFLIVEDLFKIENYIKELSNFESDLLVRNENISYVLNKINNFLHKITIDNMVNYIPSQDMFLIPSILNFFTNLSKSPSTFIMVDALLIFLNYYNRLVEKFYTSNFDISKFHKLLYNIKCLNTLVLNLFKSESVFIRQVDDIKIKSLIEKIFQSFIGVNYNNNLTSDVVNSLSENNNNFSVCSNYILLLVFVLDNDLSFFKILFRHTALRKHFLNWDRYIIKNIPFIDNKSLIDEFHKNFKNCYLWNHSSELEQILPNKKFSCKKYLVFCWVSIKFQFLGLILRHKSFREQFYKIYNNNEVDFHLKCSLHFQTVLNYLIEIMYKNKENVSNNNSSSNNNYTNDDINIFEESNKESLFYLLKEILCDFILFCTDSPCLMEKIEFINNLYKDCNKFNKPEFSFVMLLDDLTLAVKENINYPHESDK